MKIKSHISDLLFPVVLFLCFAVSALLVSLFAANAYGNIASNRGQTDAATAAAYISEKIRRSDYSEISVDDYFDCPGISFVSEEYDERFITYIYFYDNALYELNIKEGITVGPFSGAKILDLKDLLVERNATGISVVCKGADGSTADRYIATY